MKCDTLCITFKRRPNSIKFYLQVDHGTMFRKAPNEYYRTAVKEYTVELGLTYYTTEGPVLHCHTDVSYNSQTNGDAQAGVLLSIGQHLLKHVFMSVSSMSSSYSLYNRS